MSIENPILVNFSHYRHLRGIWIHSIITYFQIHSILTNKPNFRDDKMNINTCLTMNYVTLSHWLRRKNKPNSNPIKPITNPIKAKTNPIQTQTNPIYFGFRVFAKYAGIYPRVCFPFVLPGIGGYCE